MKRWLSLATVLATAGWAQAGSVTGKIVAVGQDRIEFLSFHQPEPKLYTFALCDEMRKGGQGNMVNFGFTERVADLKPGMIVDVMILMEKTNGIKQTCVGVRRVPWKELSEEFKKRALKWAVPQ
jgi:hypothetical protein